MDTPERELPPCPSSPPSAAPPWSAALSEDPASSAEPERRSKWNLALVSALVAVVCAIGGLVVLASAGRSDASRLRSQTVDVTAQSDQAAARAAEAAAATGEIATADRAALDALEGWRLAYGETVGPWSAWSDAVNHAADLFNKGSSGPAARVVSGDAAPALADLQQKVTALDQSLTDLETKVSQLREADHA